MDEPLARRWVGAIAKKAADKALIPSWERNARPASTPAGRHCVGRMVIVGVDGKKKYFVGRLVEHAPALQMKGLAGRNMASNSGFQRMGERERPQWAGTKASLSINWPAQT